MKRNFFTGTGVLAVFLILMLGLINEEGKDSSRTASATATSDDYDYNILSGVQPSGIPFAHKDVYLTQAWHYTKGNGVDIGSLKGQPVYAAIRAIAANSKIRATTIWGENPTSQCRYVAIEFFRDNPDGTFVDLGSVKYLHTSEISTMIHGESIPLPSVNNEIAMKKIGMLLDTTWVEVRDDSWGKKIAMEIHDRVRDTTDSFVADGNPIGTVQSVSVDGKNFTVRQLFTVWHEQKWRESLGEKQPAGSDGADCPSTGPHLHQEIALLDREYLPNPNISLWRNLGFNKKEPFCSDIWIFKLQSSSTAPAASPITTCPPVPTTPVLSVEPGNGQIDLSWTNPNASRTDAVTGYEIRSRVATSLLEGTWQSIGDGTTTEHVLTKLQNGTTYIIELRVVTARLLRSAVTRITATPVQTYTLTTGTQIEGASRAGGGGSITPASGDHVYPQGTKVKVSVSIAPGYTFFEWDVDGGLGRCSSQDSENQGVTRICNVTMTADTTVTAHFLGPKGLTVPSSSEGSIKCTVGETTTNCEGSTTNYDHGTTVWLLAEPDNADTHEFSHWTVSTSGGVSGSADTRHTKNPLDVTLNADTTVTATFTAKATPTPTPTPTPTYKLTATAGSGGSIECRTGSTTGTVVSCTGTFEEDTVVKIIPTVSSTHTFGSWTGCDSTSANVCTVTMTAAKTVSASFTAKPTPRYKLTATAGSGGSIQCRTGSTSGPIVSCTGTFAENTVITITASPGSTHTFGGWTGCGTTSGTTCTVTMTAAKTVIASFTAKPPPPPATYRLDARAGTGGGVACKVGALGVSCRRSFSAGTVVTITATTNTGYDFGSWTGCDSTSGATCTVTMNAAKTVRATFTVKPTPTPPPTTYQLDARAGSGGRVACRVSTFTISCGITFLPGAVVTITATPHSTHDFGSWTGCDSTNGAVCTVTMTADKTVRATFTVKPTPTQPPPPPTTHRLDARAGTGGSITCRAGTLTVGCTRTFVAGTVVTITASTNTGYDFSAWTGCDSTRANVCTVTMTAAKTVRAVFRVTPPTTYRLTIKADYRPNASGNVSPREGTHSYRAGTRVMITAMPLFLSSANWTDCDRMTATVCTVTMNSNRTVTVTFYPFGASSEEEEAGDGASATPTATPTPSGTPIP